MKTKGPKFFKIWKLILLLCLLTPFQRAQAIMFNQFTHINSSYNDCQGKVTFSFVIADYEGINDFTTWANMYYYDGTQYKQVFAMNIGCPSGPYTCLDADGNYFRVTGLNGGNFTATVRGEGEVWWMDVVWNNPPQNAVQGNFIKIRLNGYYDGDGTDPEVLWGDVDKNLLLPVVPFVTGFAATNNTECNKVKLTWTSPSGTCNGNYKVEIMKNSNLIATLDNTATSYDDANGLVRNTDYNYSIRVKQTFPNVNSYSLFGTASTSTGRLVDFPVPPSGITASTERCDGSVVLEWSWTDVNPANGFLLERAKNSTFTNSYIQINITGDKRSYSDQGLERGVNYYYRIRTRNQCYVANHIGFTQNPGESTPSSTVMGVSPAVPNRPTNIRVFTDSVNNSITIRWNDNSTFETQYLVERTAVGGGVSTFELDPNDTVYVDNSAGSCVNYLYRVKVYSSCATTGISSLQNVPAILVPNLGNTFDNQANKVKASKGYYSDRVELNWNNRNSSQLSQFRIFRKIYGSAADSTIIGTVTAGTGIFIDNNGIAGVMYKYTVVGETQCAGVTKYSNYSEDIGFRSPAGLINGSINYAGGFAVKGVKVMAQNASGVKGSCLSFNGVNNYLSVPNSSSLNPSNNQLTLEAWVKPLSRKNFSIISKMDANGGYKLSYDSLSNALDFFITGNGSTKKISVSNPFITFNNWNQVSATFTADSIRIYINGIKKAEDLSGSTRLNSNSIALIIGNSNEGGACINGSIDEVRIWKRAKFESEIAIDYNRTVNPDDPNLVAYYTFDERVAGITQFFDNSNNNFIFNENHGTIFGATFSDSIPTSSQLALAAYTDENGLYTIPNVRYSGTGQNFNVVPLLPSHNFSPSQRAIFIGDNSQIQNGIDFIDNSSFDFVGHVTYAGTSCAASGANVYIDGSPAILANMIVTVNDSGIFRIRVPIGNHIVSLSQNKHIFSQGTFPSSGVYNFQSPITAYFVDSTVLKVVGRVVGGNRELNKVAGLGRSKNNIGKAQFTFTTVGNPSVNNCQIQNIVTNDSTGEYTAYLFPLRYSITGLKLVNNPDLTLLTNPQFNNPNILDLTAVPDVISVIDTFRSAALSRVDQTTYHKRLDFKYFVKPQIFVTDLQTPFDTLVNNFIGERTLKFGDSTINISNNLLGYPVFQQSKFYVAKVKVIEVYNNIDKAPGSSLYQDNVPVSGTLQFFNNLATTDDTTRSAYIANGTFNYNFRAGSPNQLVSAISPNYTFTKTFQIQFAPDLGITVDWQPNTSDPINKFYRAFVFGAKSGGANFTTTGPAMVDLILRDPPGSASYTAWQSGKSFSSTSSYTLTNAVDIGLDLQIFMGTAYSTAGVDADMKNSVTLGFNQSYSLTEDGELTETLTNTTTIQTSGDPAHVGASADVFFGKATNIIFGISDNVRLIDTTTCRINAAQQGGNPVCFGPIINGYQMGLSKGMFVVPGEIKSTFVYTADEIENQVIPSLVDLRNQILNRGTLNKRGVRRYTPVFNDDTDPDFALKFGANNDDDIWGTDKVNSQRFITDLIDSAGPSYVFSRDSIMDVDSITYYNTQIRLWKQALAQNEKEKYQIFRDTSILAAVGGRNISIGSASYQQDFTTEADNSSSKTYEIQLGGSIATEIGGLIGGKGLLFHGNIAYNNTQDYGSSTTATSSTTLTYFLQDGDDGNLISVDIVDGQYGNGHIFRLRAGRTSCPFEDAVYAHYYDPNLDSVSASTYIDQGVELSAATAKIEVPEIDVLQQSIFNIPPTEDAVFTLELGNLSEARQDVDYDLRIDESTNPYGAIIKVDGLDPNRTFTVPYGTSVQKTLTLERGPVYYDYNNIRLILKSGCDDNIFDTISISAKFLPTCTGLSLKSPDDRWTLNNNYNDTLPVLVGDYNYNFGGFKNVYFQYKPASGSTWFNEKTYFKDTPDANVQIPIGTAQIFYPFNFKNLPDGNYEIRAVSECTAPGYPNTKVSSPILQGLADRVNPHPFGNPQPADGILSPNDEVSIQFNEPIDNASLSSANFDVRGVLNGTSYSSSTSLFFDGNNDYVEIPSGLSLQKRSFTIEFWAKRNTLGKQMVFSQGVDSNEYFAVGFDENDKLCFLNGYEKVMANNASTDLLNYHHYAVAYDFENEKVNLFIDGVLVNTGNNNFFSDYNGGGKTYIGRKSSGELLYYKGNLREFRLWNRPRTAIEIASSYTKQLKGTESGILANWRLDEADGTVVKDYIRSRNGEIVNAIWEINPSGRSYQLTGTNSGLKIGSSDLSLNSDNDFTLEFWFKANNDNLNTCLFSNGKADSTDLSPELKWSIEKGTDGKIYVIHQKTSFEAVSTNYFDGNWHHFALIMKRNTSLSAYIDGNLQNTTQPFNYGQMGGSHLWLGARGYQPLLGESTDKYFNGKLDEFRIWNISRTQEQITRDRLNRLLGTEPGLICYFPFESYALNLGVPVLSPSLQDVVLPARTVTALDLVSGFSTETPRINLPRPVQAINFNYAVNNDKVILTPTTSPELIENVTLDITVKNVYDLHGNIMQSPKTWIAYMDKNQVKWQDEEFSFVKKIGQSQTFTSTIVNSGGAIKQFTIDNLPSWLSASPSSGTITPNSTKVVTFTLDPNANIGNYEQDVHLTTDFGFPEKLNVKLKVYADAPSSWTVNPNSFAHTMNIIGQVRINNTISTNVDDRLGAFVNGQCRGVANIQYFPQYDRYLVFLSIHSNVGEGEPIEFRIWNSGEGKVHSDVEPLLTFKDNAMVGAINNPTIFNASDKTIRQIPLKAGWNWVSFNLLMPDSAKFNSLFSALRPENGMQIKNNTELAVYDHVNGWSGNLANFSNGIKPEKSYLLHSARTDTLTIKGIEPNPVFRPITIQAGWNWIGFVSQRNISVTEALSSYNAKNGDILKSQTQFTVYDSLMGWVGSLTTLRPNGGYLYKTDSGGVLVYPKSAMFGKKPNPENAFTSKHWSLNPYPYTSNMNLIASMNICKEMLASGNWLIGAFVNGSCRGYALPQQVNNGNYQFFLTINGTDGEQIELKLLDEVSGASFPIKESLEYNDNLLKGNITKPIALTLSSSIDCIKSSAPALANTVTVYPVPFNENLSVNINLSESQMVSITIYDISGKVVKTIAPMPIDKGNRVLSLNTQDIEPGIYIIETATPSESFRNKIIKH